MQSIEKFRDFRNHYLHLIELEIFMEICQKYGGPESMSTTLIHRYKYRCIITPPLQRFSLGHSMLSNRSVVTV